MKKIFSILLLFTGFAANAILTPYGAGVSIYLSGTYTAPVAGIAPLLYYDGTKFQTDPIPSHLGYNASTDTVYTAAINISNATTNTAKFTNTGTQGASAGAGMQGFSDDGSAILSGSRLGFYLLGGATDAAHTTSNSAGMSAFATENWTGTAAGSRLDFETTANAGLVRSAKMSILGSGNVGVGTQAPGNLLHINSGATPTNGSVRLTANNLGSISYFVYAANNSAMSFDSDYAGAAWVARDTSAFSLYKNSGNLNFYGDSGLTLNTAFTPTNRMTLTGAGLLGIGLAAPTHKLEVTGVGQLTAALTDAGDKTNTLFLSSTSTSAGAGGSLVFGNVQTTGAGAEGFAAIKGLLTNGAGTTLGNLAFSTRNSTADTALTERMRLHGAGGGMSIGTTTPNLGLNIVGSQPAATAGQQTGLQSSVTYGVADSGTKIGFLTNAIATANQTNLMGEQVLANVTGTAAITNMYGSYYGLALTGAGTATATNGYSLFIGGPSGTGLLSNAFGIYVANQQTSTVTNGNAIYSAGGAISLNDSNAKTAQYIFTTINNNATSSTAAINKYGLNLVSTGTWNGASALNVALNASATGGTLNRTMMTSMTDTSPSGVPVAALWTHTYTQSATAGSTDLNINRIETSIGSGVHKFVDFSVGGTSKFSVSNKGTTTQAGGHIGAVRVVTAAGAVTVTGDDYYVVINKTVGAATAVSLPAGVIGQTYYIKDGKGDGAVNNITITPAAGTIDGAATRVINTNYGSVEIFYNGTEWNVAI